MKRHVGRTKHSRSAGCLVAYCIRARKSAFPTSRSNGSSSGNPGACYSADFSGFQDVSISIFDNRSYIDPYVAPV